MATMPQNYNDPLAEESAPSLSFKDAAVGTMYKGVITARPKLVPSRDFETGNPKTWSDGNPVLAVVILLNVQGESRSLWAQKPSAMFAALVAAQKEAGGKPMEEGGELYVKFVGETPNTKNPRLNPAKQYQAKYIPPPTTVAQPDPFDEVDTAGRIGSPTTRAQAGPTKPW